MRLVTALFLGWIFLGLAGCASSAGGVSAEPRGPASIGPTQLSAALRNAKVRIQHTDPKGCAWVAVYKTQGLIDTPAVGESGLYAATQGIYTSIVEAVQTYGADVFVIDSATIIPAAKRENARQDEILMVGRIFKCGK